MAGLNAGDLDREIVIQTLTRSQDSDTGAEILTVSSSETVWAQWLPAGTREAWQAQQRLGSYVEGVFRVYDLDPRPTPDLSRIVFEDRIFDVKPPIEMGREDGLEIPVVARGE